ncbi:DUF1697 domain-containing protein [Altererythrobacter salegens]|uniref:DUF1697 domain-containing protein n=1 Tax=Croceibacterium salegens TaxID=1737568 RepID=A0A6I4SPX2_9SPHN|nr:DUF1697 domain-containing protein [Croceibacterium salegens]MXO57961.1 DUF1697 domain-containing protein [Croceibacterium salegens]
MTRYVALLGSINVGGNRLKMADLREALEREDFENVETVVASGNVLFDHDERPSDGLGEKIAYVVRDRFGFDTFAAVRSRDELAASISGNPFAEDGEPKQVHTLFLAEPFDTKAFEDFAAGYAGPERLACAVREIFVDFCGGVADSKLGQAMSKARVGGRATARNINSLRRILDKMG